MVNRLASYAGYVNPATYGSKNVGRRGPGVKSLRSSFGCQWVPQGAIIESGVGAVRGSCMEQGLWEVAGAIVGERKS